MYSDLLFNFSQMTEDSGQGYGAEILEHMAASKPLFALDGGMAFDDIWHRADVVRACLELIQDEKIKNTI